MSQRETDLQALRDERTALAEDIREQETANRAASPSHLMAAINETIAKLEAEVEQERQEQAEAKLAECEAIETQSQKDVRSAVEALAQVVGVHRANVAATDSAQRSAGRTVSLRDRVEPFILSLLASSGTVDARALGGNASVLARYDAEAVSAQRRKEEDERRIDRERQEALAATPEAIERKREREIGVLHRRLQNYPPGSRQKAAVAARERLAVLEAEADDGVEVREIA